MTRIPMIAGNWKMNKTTSEAVSLSQDISYGYDSSLDDVELVICPPFIDLKSVSTVLSFDKSRIALGAQDVFWERSGAFTGEISPGMLKEVGCRYCIIGHSERREHFFETNETVNLKVHALLNEGITPIICCGEDLATREAGETLPFVISQIKAALEGLNEKQAADLVIAYEPIWAIGTGRTATPEAADEVCAAIRQTVGDLFSDSAAQSLRVLYGGSMKPENVSLFVPMPNIDGGLIGGAALEARSFIDLAKAFA
ncbi:MAG: triose-phosphate isomerase [Coriobacteriaceae bacterium]|nr:triose-phosphate isomerase [Coriobacteriaceae bacterium]